MKRFALDKYTYLLVLIVAFHIVLNLFWQKVNTAPPTWDSAGHLAISFIFADRIPQFIRNDHVGVLELIKTSVYYPPLIHFLGGLIILFFGRNYEIPLFVVGTFFLVLSIIFLYKIVLKLFNNKQLALTSAFIFSFFPQIWEQSRNFHLDLPLCALMLVSYYFLIISAGLTKKKESLLFFLFFALSQLTKWYGFVFLSVPLFYELVYKPYKSNDLKNHDRLTNLIIGVFIIAVVALPWYLINLGTLLSNFKIAETADAGDPANVLSYESIFHYLELMTSHQIGFVSLIFMFFGVFTLRKTQKGIADFVIYLILVPYTVFTLISNKDLRYILPLAPMFAFLIGYYLQNTWTGVAKLTRNIIYFVYMIAVFFFLSFNQFLKIPDNLAFIGYAISGPYGSVWVYEPQSYTYNSQDWRGEDVVRQVQYLADANGISSNHFRVLEVSDARFYSTASFDMYKLQNRFYNLDFVVPYYRFAAFSSQELAAYLSDINYALIPDSPGPPGLRNIVVLDQLVNFFKSNENTDFAPFKKFDLPDGNAITLYQRKSKPVPTGFVIKPGSVVFRLGNILWLDKEAYGNQPFDINISTLEGAQTKTVDTASGQARIPLQAVDKVVVNLPPDKISVEQLQGWDFQAPNTFLRNTDYTLQLKKANFRVLYHNLTFKPAPETQPISGVVGVVEKSLQDKITLTLSDLTTTVYVAYATKGWVWNSATLSAQQKSVVLPVADLLQLEITSPSLLIDGFKEDWGYFTCYDGKAVCFYPLGAVL